MEASVITESSVAMNLEVSDFERAGTLGLLRLLVSWNMRFSLSRGGCYQRTPVIRIPNIPSSTLGCLPQVGVWYILVVNESSSARSRAAETKRQRSRAAILESATRLFKEQGWLPTTVEGIAREAGVGTATVYNHFGNKNLIAGFAFLPLVQDLLEDYRWHDEAVPPSAALRDFVVELATRTRAEPSLTVALLEAVNDSTARRGAQVKPDDPRYVLPLPRQLVAMIARGQASGEFFDYPTAAEAGPLFFNLLMLRVLTRPGEPAAETARLILTIMERTFGVALQDG